MLLRLLCFLLLSAVSFLPPNAGAQVSNGGFENGGTGWQVLTPPGNGWTSGFPSSGGNPGGYATFRTQSTGGQGRLRQTFNTLSDTPDTCLISFQFKIENTNAVANSARVICSINGEEVYTSEDAGLEGIPWTTAQFRYPCGEVAFEASLQVDPGSNSWEVCFDNVLAEVVDPVVPVTWGRIKVLFGAP